MASVTPTLDARELAELCRKIRIRLVSMVGRAGCGHLGGSLSAAEVLTALYFGFLRIDPANPRWAERDRFVLSKGHCTPLYYVVLAERGFFPHSWLQTYGHLGSPLQGHPDMTRTPGVDMSTGSLGQGISAAVGMRIAAGLLERRFRVFTMIGDGEAQEGQVWEAALYAGAHALEGLICIIDHNGLQLASSIEQGLPLGSLARKWEAFGWHVLEIDGHSMPEVLRGIGAAIGHRGAPVALISHTVKGKGVSFMEGVPKWHSAVPTREEVGQALGELGASEEEMLEWQ